MLHNVLYTSEPMTIYKYLLPFEISHGCDTRFSSRCKLDNLLLKKPVFEKKTFLARASITRTIESWNNLDSKITVISSKSRFESAHLKARSVYLIFLTNLF